MYFGYLDLEEGIGGVAVDFDDDVYDSLPRDAAVMAIDAVWRDGLERGGYSLKQNRQRKADFGQWEAEAKRWSRARETRNARKWRAGWKARQAAQQDSLVLFPYVAPARRTGGDRRATVSIPYWLDEQRRKIFERLTPWGSDWGARLRVTREDPTLAGVEFDFDATRFGHGHFVKELLGLVGWWINVEDTQGRRWWVDTNHVEVARQ